MFSQGIWQIETVVRARYNSPFRQRRNYGSDMAKTPINRSTGLVLMWSAACLTLAGGLVSHDMHSIARLKLRGLGCNIIRMVSIIKRILQPQKGSRSTNSFSFFHFHVFLCDIIALISLALIACIFSFCFVFFPAKWIL